MNITTSPIGMLMKNTNGQPMVSVIRPPMAGPSRLESPNTAPNSPWYLPRSEGAKRSAMIASAIGNSAPAPRPWIPRAADELPHLVRQAREHGADHEHADAEQEDRPAAEQVGQLAVERAR